MQYGCIGEKLSHSFSVEIHEALGSYSYTLEELAQGEVKTFLQQRNFQAINVTIPYKETVIPYLDEIDEVAEEIGAVNTIVNREGRLIGYNTDFYGLCALFSHIALSPCGKKVAILGTGGTSKTAFAVTRFLGAREILVVSRAPSEGQISYETLTKEHPDTEIIINTTPVGMYPNSEGCPLALDGFSSLFLVVDAVYNPLCTTLVREAKKLGILAEGGLYMLVAQAVRASELFLSMTYPEATIDRVFDEIVKKKENIVLVGMPTSGKSTVGRMLSVAMSRPFVDTDELFYKRFGISPEEHIEKYGEESFREKESLICREVSSNLGCVIATGGGVVLREGNLHALSQNGTIVFLDRPLEDLIPSDSHPLSRTPEALAMRYHERIDKYLSFADITVRGSHTAEETVRIILDRIQQRNSK